MLLSLDLNTKRCGLGFGGPQDGSPRLGTWQLFGTADEDALARSCAALYRSISDLCKLIHPQFVYYEAPFNPQDARGHTNHQAVRGLLSLAAVAMAAGRNAGAMTYPAHVQSWRKSFCGHGRPENPKQATIARCNLLGWSVANDDEADAAGVWAYGMSIRFPKWAPKATPLFSKGRVA